METSSSCSITPVIMQVAKMTGSDGNAELALSIGTEVRMISTMGLGTMTGCRAKCRWRSTFGTVERSGPSLSVTCAGLECCVLHDKQYR
jgi:hypothetical protein